jgi:hypothetical protein
VWKASPAPSTLTLSFAPLRFAHARRYTLALLHVVSLPKEHNWTRIGLTVCLLMRCGPALAAYLGLPYFGDVAEDITGSHWSVVADGFFMAIVVSDITLAKMSGREIHPWVVAMSFCSMFSHTIIFVSTSVARGREGGGVR